MQANATDEVKDDVIDGTNETCIRPAIEQFPEPLMNKKARQYGGLIIHIAVAIYMFIGLAVVCDDYFVPALDKISDGEDHTQT